MVCTLGEGFCPPRRNHKKATSGKGLSSRLSIPLCLCAVTALALLTVLPTSSAQADDLLIKGGDGISGNEHEVNNGSPVNRTEAGTAYGTVTVVGGNGGNGGDNNGVGGGNGGDASLTLSDNVVSVHTLLIQGGNDGNDGNGITGGNGGHGGNAAVQADNISVGSLLLQSGMSNNAVAASFTANTLKTGDIALNKGDGSLNFTVNNALVWTGNGAFTVTNGGFIEINSLTIDGGTVNKDNYAHLISADAYYTTKVITLGSNGATFDASGGDQSVSRVLTGAGSLTKTGAGTLTLTGNNNYTGATTINGGTLKGNITSGTDLNIATGASYDGDNAARSVSALNGGGNIRNTNGLTVQSGDFSGVMDASNTGGLTKTGVGTLTLTGNNTYTGATTIDAGTLQIGNGGTSGSITGNIVNNASLAFNRSDDLSHAGIISGAGSLTKSGAGTLTLTGDNTYTGRTSIDAGTLQIGNGGTSGSITGNIVNNASLAFNRSDDLSHAGIISGVGSLTKDGAGTLTLTGNNSYTGGTTIDAGTLALSGEGNLSTSSLLALRGGNLDISAISTGSLSLPDLDVHGSANLNIGGKTANFSGKTLSFYVPSDMNDGGTLLSVSGTGTTDISNSTVQVGIEGAYSPLLAGDAITLIDVPDGTLQGDPSNTSSKGEGMQGVTLRYEFDLATNGNRLTATVAGMKTDPRAKALSEGFLAGMALNLQGADLVAGRGLDSAVQESSGTDDAEGHGVSGFGALSGGSLRYDSGSHIDMKSLSVLTGLARGVDLKPGRLTTGAFFEYGNGSYDTYNSFSNAASVHGDGHSWYMGVGMLARMDYVDSGRGRYYAEASARVGKTHNKYGSLDLRDAVGRTADYDSSSAYYGLHVGSGYIWNLSEKSSLDVYGKYFWTRQQGDSVGLSTGETLRFEDADSSRLRLGGRFAYTVNERVSTYIGAAWEHEFDGKARATTNGFAIDAPSLRGGSGLCELGLSLRPSADRPLTIDLGVQGYVGKREGVTGSVQVNFEF